MNGGRAKEERRNSRVREGGITLRGWLTPPLFHRDPPSSRDSLARGIRVRFIQILGVDSTLLSDG